jgi:hypothetical protein
MKSINYVSFKSFIADANFEKHTEKAGFFAIKSYLYL